MFARIARASLPLQSKRPSLMRGVSWLPLAAVALVANTVDVRAQAVNVGGMQARMPTRGMGNTIPAGVQRQSPGNSIVTDGQTATNVRVNGRTTTITTSTISGGNAFNSFKTFSEAEGNTVNLIVPNQAGKLVNIVREGQVNIQGTLNAYQHGKIGGNVVFADSYGLVVGASGSVNVGSLTVVTPNKATLDRMIVGGKVNEELVARVVTGDVPLSADGSVVISGRVNATHSIRITATDIRIAGSLEAAQRAAEQKAQFAATVNTRGWKGGGGQLVARGGSISISGANSVDVAGTVRAGSTRHAGSISIAAGKSAQVSGTLKAEGASGRNGGKIQITSGGDIAIDKTAKLSVSGVGQNSNAGAIIVKAGNNLAVADGSTFNARGGATGDGGFVELSAAKTETLGKINLDLGAAVGKVGSLLLDPTDLVINAASSIATGGANIELDATNSITLASTGIIDTRSNTGGTAGDLIIAAPHIILQGGSQILAGSGATAGSVTLTALATSGSASVLIGDTGGSRATITGKNLTITATANDGGTTEHATVLVQNADVTLTGKLDATATATVSKSVTFVGAVAVTDVLAAVDVLDGANLQIGGAATLSAIASTTVNATAAPNAVSTKVADAAAAVVTATSIARAQIAGTAVVNATGALKLAADNTVTTTSKADASSTSNAGTTVAVNVLDVTTTAQIAGAAAVTAGSLELDATSKVTAVTSAKAAAQGAGEADSGSKGGQYLSDAKYSQYEKTSDGGVKAAGALAIADVTSTTLARMASSQLATITGTTILRSVTGNSSVVVADGSSATGSNGVGVAVGVGLAKISNKSLVEQQIATQGLALSATMTGTAADNNFSVTATSGAAASNVGVAGALATNLLDSESWARFAGSANANGKAVSVTAADLSSATAVAGPSGTGGTGDKVGIGASVALNLVATRATAELADGATLSNASDVSLQATGDHVMSTKAEQGSEGGISVTPVLALTMASDRTVASIGALTGGLDFGASNTNITVTATQTTTALTQASGTAAGGKAGIGAALAVAVLDEQTIATTSSSIRTGGAVSFTAQGAALAATAAVASASGGKAADDAGNSTDGDASADAKIAKETKGASDREAAAGVGNADQQKATGDGAKSENGQGKTSDGSVAVAAAIAATVLQSTVQAYVPASVGVSSGALKITSVANTAAKTTADGSAVGSDSSTAKVGVGVGLSINLVRSTNNALLGAGTPLSIPVGTIVGITADRYSVTSLSLKAAQDDLGAIAPVITVASKTPVDPAKLAQATIVASTGQRLNTYEANASAGAGASSVGVAGAVALNLVDTQSLAQVAGGASVSVSSGGSVSANSDNESSTIARAVPAGSGAAGGKVGVGASVALNLVATRSTAELADGATVIGAGDVTLQAVGVHGVVTQAEQGSSGGVAVTPVLATSMVSDRTKASIGALTGGLVATGNISVNATQLSSALTQASGTAAGGKAAVGAALAIAVLDEQTIATTASSIRTDGAVSFTAKGASLAATAAIASASGGNGADDSGKSTDKDGSVDDKVQKQSGDSSQRMSDAKIGDTDQQASAKTGGANAKGQESTSEGGVAVAAAIAVDASVIKVNAYVPSSVGVAAKGALSVSAVSNVDVKTSADGSTTAASGSGSTPTKVGVGAAVAINVVSVENRAELGVVTPATAAGQITGPNAVAASTYGASALNVSALKTDLGVASPAVLGGPADIAHAPSATTANGRVDQIVAYAKSGASGANVSVAGSLAVNVLTSKSIADIDSGTVTITPVVSTDGAVVLAADHEAYVAASALPAQDGASGSKVGVGASVALNTALTTSEARLATNVGVNGATSVSVKAGSHLDSDALAQAGAKGGTALDAVVAFTILSERTAASIDAGALLTVAGNVEVRATSDGSHSAIASGSSTSSGSGGTAIGGAVALVTGTGLFNLVSGGGGPVTSETTATIARNISATGDLSVAAAGTHAYAASATATAAGGSADDKGAAGGSDSTSSKTLGSAPAGDSMKQEQDGVSANGGGSSGGKLSVAAALGAAIVGDSVKAGLNDALTIHAGSVSIKATSTDQVQSLGNASSVSSQQDNGIGIGAALTIVGNTTKASIGDSTHIVSGGAIGVNATSSMNNGLGGFTAEAMSGASGKKLAVAGALAIGISNSTTSATIGNNLQVDIAGDAFTRAGAVSVIADNTSALASKAWSGSYSAEGTGVGASIAAAISNDSYTASIGNNAAVTAASVDVSATNERVDDVFSSIKTLAAPVAGTLNEVKTGLTDQVKNASDLIADVDSASGAVDAVKSFKSGFADQIAADKKKILDTLKSTATLARDLPILGSNNFYTEVVAGAASGEKLAISGGLALQVLLEKTSASIGTGANINATGAVAVEAHDNAISRTLVGTLAASGGSSAAGISLGIIVNSGTVDAGIGAGSTISKSGSIGVVAGADHLINLFEVSAGAADANGIAGILGVVYSGAAVNAKTGAGSTLKSDGLLNVAATNTINTLNLAGGVAIGGNNGIGGVLISTTINNTANATIDSNATSATTVSVGAVSVSAQTKEQLINVAVAGAGAGSNAIAGVATPLIQILSTQASIGANARVVANSGDISVAAGDSTVLINVGGVISIGGSNGVGGAAAVGVLTDTVKAFIGDDATIDSAGAVNVTANARETISDAVVSGSGGGNVGVAVALASSVVVDNVSATIGKRDRIGSIIRPTGVRVAADDTTLVVDIAGTIGVGGGTGVGAGVDANVLTKTTTATIDTGVTIRSRGDVVVQATSAETVYSLVAGFAAGGDAGVAGSVGTFVLAGNTLATINGATNISVDGNVGVIAKDANELNRLVGSGAVGGTAGVGGAIGVSVAVQTTKATISDDATVDALGQTQPTLGVVTGIGGSFNLYGADALSVIPGLSSLSGTVGNDVNAVTVGDGLIEGGSLLVLQRTTTPEIQQVHGVAVSASATSLLRSLVVSGSVGGTAGISISGDLPVVVSDTEATIGARAKVNTSIFTPGAGQSVVVAASSDLYHLGIAGSVAVGGTAGVGAGAETAVFNNTTLASIGAASDVRAASDVAVTAKASENFAGSAVSAGVGGTAGVAGGLTGHVVTDVTKATIFSGAGTATSVRAGGNVIVDADDQTRAVVTGGTIAIGASAAGVGMGVGLTVVVKDTEATIGDYANVTGLGNGTGADFKEYTGADFTGYRTGRGVLVQANSGQSVTGIVIAGAGGLYAGVAGVIAAEVFVDQTRASIGQNASINSNNAGANANQDVFVTARDSTVVVMTEGTVAVGIAGVGGAVDVAVITDATSAYVGDGVTINANRDVSVAALTNRQTSSTVASVAGGIGGVGAAISVLAIANGPNADQTSKTDSNGSFNDSANSKLSDNTIDSKFLSSSSNSNVRNASSTAQGYKSTATLQKTLPTGIAPGNSATIGNATVNAGGNVNVRAHDTVNAIIADGAVTAAIGGGAGIGVAVVDVANTAIVTNGAHVTAGALDVAAISERTMNGVGIAATAAGVSAALISITDATATTASVHASTVNTGSSAQVRASNNEQIVISTTSAASGAAGGLSLVVLKPDTEARIDGNAIVNAATSANGSVVVSSSNTINVIGTAAGAAIGGGGGVGLTVVTELPTTVALIDSGSTITSGLIAAATAGDVLVSATMQESMLSLGAGVAIGDGLGGALTVVTRSETTNAEIAAATVTATGNVGVTANSTSADDLAIGGAAVGGGAGVGASLGVTVLSSTVTASIHANADVTALGLGADLNYIKDYQTNFTPYVGGDTIKTASLAGVSGGQDRQAPVSTGDVSDIGSSLLLKKGTIGAVTAVARGVVVNAASAQSIRSIAVSGAAAGGIAVGLSGTVPVILDTTSASIGAGAHINQRLTGSAGALQSAIVAATNQTYALNIVGAVAGGGAAGVGASLTTAVVSNITTATIGHDALVSARNDVAVTALAGEDLAMVAAAGAFGGYVGIAGGLSLISIDNTTKALIDTNAVVVAGNNAIVSANDITREATFAGAIVLSGGGAVGAAVSVGLINKQTTATIDTGAHVSGLAQGTNTFAELTGANITDSRAAKGILVDAESVESAYIFALGGGAGAFVAAAGAIDVNVYNINTFATINSGAVINGVAGGTSQQDVAVNARDLAGIVGTNYGIAVSGLASLAGGVDVGVLNTNVGASIGDATVNAGNDVLVNALANKAINSTAVSAAAAPFALSAGVSVYAIGNGVDPNGKASSELQTSSGSVSNYAGSSLSVGGQLGSTTTSTTSAVNSKNSGSSTATSSASDVSSMLNNKLGSIDVTGKMTAQNALVAGTSATMGNAHVTATGAVKLNGTDQVAYAAKTGALSVGGIGVGAGIGIFTDNATTTATATGTGTGNITAGAVSVAATTNHSANLSSFAGSVALLGALEADVALVTDNSVTRAGITGYTIAGAAGLTVAAASNRQLNASASGVAAALGAGIGVSVANASIGGSVSTNLQDLTIGSSGSLSGDVTAQATSNDSATASASAAAGGIGGAGSGAEANASVNLPVALTLNNANIHSNGGVTLLAKATDSANATSKGVAVAGGLAVGGSVANASLSPQVSISITGGDIEATSLQSDAQALSGGVNANATGASGAFFAGINATSASASDTSRAIATGIGGIIQTSGALNFNAKSTEATSANASGLAVGIVAIGANYATATTDRQTKATFVNMTKLAGGSVGLDAESFDNNTAYATSGSGGVIAGASANARTSSNNVTAAQITGTLGSTRTVVDSSAGLLSIVAHHTESFAGTVDTRQAAVVGASGARLTHDVTSAVAAGIGDNVDSSARNLTIDAANAVTRTFIGGQAADQAAWDVQSGSGGFVDGPAASGTTTVQVTTMASLGQNANVHLIGPATDYSVAMVTAANDITVQQKTKVDSGGAISIANGQANVTVNATATAAFGTGSSLVVDIGDLTVGAWSNVNVDARTAVSSSGLAGAPNGSAKANVNVNDLLSVGRNVRLETSNGVISSDGLTPTHGNLSLYAGTDLKRSAVQTLSLNTVVDLYNNTAIPIPTTPDAQSNLVSSAVVSIAQSDAPAAGDTKRYGVNAAGDISIFADRGQMTTNATGTGTNIYLEALSKTLTAISNFFGGGDVSFDIKGGSTSQTGASTLIIDGVVDTGIARNKSLLITYKDATCDPGTAACVVATGNILSSNGTFQAGGAILDRLGQIDALLVQYAKDTIALAAYTSEKTFLQAKLVSLGLATIDKTSGVFSLNSGVVEGSPAGASVKLTVLTDALAAFRSDVTTTIGSVLGDGLSNIAAAWNGSSNATGAIDSTVAGHSFVNNARSTLLTYSGLSNYASGSFDVTDITTQIGIGTSALASAWGKLTDTQAKAVDITTQVAAIVGTQQDVALGNKSFASVQTSLVSAFGAISTDQQTIVSNNAAMLLSTQAMQTAAAKVLTELSNVKTAASDGSNGNKTIISNAVGTLDVATTASAFITTQIDGGTLPSGLATPATVTGIKSAIATYAASVTLPITATASHKSVADWQTDLNAKAQDAAGSGTAGAVGKDSVYVQLANTGVQLGSVYLGAQIVKTTTGSGKILAPGDARIEIDNETAATLKIQNLNIPVNNAGRITVNGVEVHSAADITGATGKASNFADANIVSSSGSAGAQINITSNYNPESATYYDPSSSKKYLNTLQVAPDIILLDTATINNLTGSVNILSEAGNIYIQGKINAGSISIVARNGDLVTSYVNGFNHVGGDPAGSTVAQNAAVGVTPADPITTGLGLVANGQVFLAARYLNINSTVQSGIANWTLNLTDNTQLVTKDASRIGGMDASEVAGRISDYLNLAVKTNIPTTHTYANGVTLNLLTSELTFSLGTVQASSSSVFSGSYKFLDTGSNKDATGVYNAQAGASYDATNGQVVIDGTSVHGGYIKVFGQIINTSNTGAGNLNVLDGFGTINITNTINVPVVLSTVSTGADPDGTGRGTKGMIDITDVHIDPLNANVVDATHTVFTRDFDFITKTGSVVVNQEQGIINAKTGLFVPVTGAVLTSVASSTGDRTGVYNPMATQRYVYMTTADYSVVNKFDVSSDNIFHSSDLAVNKQSVWQNATSSTSAPVRLLDGSYVSIDYTDTTKQTIDGTTKLVSSQTPSQSSNASLENTQLVTTTVNYLKQSSQTQTGSSSSCNWYTLCIASKETAYYTATTDYRQITTNSVKADYPIKVNFIGSDTGSINIISGSDITLKGNVTNVAGTTTITSTNGSIIQSAINPTITAKSINLSAGGSVGGVVPTGSFAAQPLQVALTNIGGSHGKLAASAGDGVVAINALADLIVGQVTAGGSAAAGRSNVTLWSGTNINPFDSSSYIQGSKVSLTAVTGSIGSVANNNTLTVNTGYTLDQSLRPFGDPATTSGLIAYYGLSASAGGDINIQAKSWAGNSSATILANSIVSNGGDIKLTTPGQVLDGNPIQQIDTRTYAQLVNYWDSLGLTAGTNNAARQASTIQAYEQSETQAYRQYWQLRLAQPNGGAAFDPTYQVTYAKGTAQYQSLDTYYRNLETTNNAGVAPVDIDARVAADIAKQAADDTARYRSLNGQVGSLTTTFDSGYTYTASAAEKSNLVQGATWTENALGFPLSAGALKTLTNTNPVIKAPNVAGRNVTILADGGIGETVIVNGQSAPGLKIDPTNKPAAVLTDAQKVALATAERSDLVLTVGRIELPANATAAQIAAYQEAVAAGITNTPTDIPLGLDETKMTTVQRAALDAAAAGIAVLKPGVSYLTVLSKRPLNVAETESLNVTVTAPVSTAVAKIDQGKVFIASRGDLPLGTVDVTGETRIKAIGSLINAATSSIKTGNIVLESANGSIGAATPLLLNLRPDATITARALNLVNLCETAGSVNGTLDANIDTIYSPNNVKVEATGSILNANNDLQVNIYGGNILLTADNGSIGSLANSLNVGTTPGGVITAAASYGMVNLYGVAGLDFTIGSDLAGTSTKLVAAVDGTIAGPVTAGTDITMSAGSRLVLTGVADVLSAAGDIQVSADSVKMLRNAKITANTGSVRIVAVHDALVSNIIAGSSNLAAIDLAAGGHLIASGNPIRPFDLSAMTPGAGIRLTAGLGIGDQTEADLYAVDQKGSPVGSANLITAIANPFRLRTNAIDARTTIGDVNLIALTSISGGSIVTGGGNIDIVGKQDFRVSNISATAGNITANITGAFGSANILATATPSGDRGHVTLEAGADIDVGTSRSVSMWAQTPTHATFNDVTVDNPITVAADVTDIGVLHASGHNSTPLFFTLTGYHGNIGERANVYIDAPLGVVMPLIRENEATIGTNAMEYLFADATIGRWMKFTTPAIGIWDDNRSPRPVLGNFDVQLFQPLKQFYLYQNGVRTVTNAAVIQYDERAEVIELRNPNTMPGGSLVRDIDRIGMSNFLGIGSVLLRDDSPDHSGSFFYGDTFIHFLESLRDRNVRRPIKGPVVNLKGLASTESFGD